MDKVKDHFDQIAQSYDTYKSKHRFYYSNLKSLLASLISPHKKVLEIGCGTGDLLGYLRPKYGFGVDISPQMISIAKIKHPRLLFSTKFPKDRFDYVFMSDVIEHLSDPLAIFARASRLIGNKSKFVITMANPKWEPVLMLAEKLHLKMPEGPHNRINFTQLQQLLSNSGFQITSHDYFLLCPIFLPVLTKFINSHLEKHFKAWSFIEYVVAE